MSHSSSLTDLDGVGEALAERLRAAGIETPAAVATASVSVLTEVEGISRELARRLKAQVDERPSESSGAAGTSLTPGEWTVTERQAVHIESLGLGDADDLVESSALDLRDELDPFERFHLPFFRRICGRVVAEDPESGEMRPVPNATVTVYDTDCDFLGYFPVESPYSWFYPFRCRREQIGRTQTDECGCFCVFVPWWDIDRVLRDRLERVCIPEIVRPTVGDLLDPDDDPRPGPVPDPGPDGPRFTTSRAVGTRVTGRRDRSLSIDFDSPGRFEYVEGIAGRDVASELAATSEGLSFGDTRDSLTDLLDRPAFTDPVAPPLPPELRRHDEWIDIEDYDFGVDPDVLEQIDPSNVIGPLLRCHYVFVPDWQTIYDVPDITFEVTQDTDGDGVEETIYDEGYFEVRWNDVPSGSRDCPPGDFQLQADSSAFTVPSCRTPDPDLFVCTEPSVVAMEDMPLQRPYHEPDSTVTTEPAAGYQRLVNRPQDTTSSSRTPTATGEAPYCGTLQLHGCSRVGDATHYRVVYRRKPDEDATDWSTVRPFTGHEWVLTPLSHNLDPYPVAPGANGWYENLTVDALEDHYGVTFGGADEPSDLLTMAYLLLQWPTHRYPNGRYDVRVQVGVEDGSGGMTVTQESDWMPVVVDNTRPTARIERLQWWYASESRSDARTIHERDSTGDPACPVIRRRDEDIFVRVEYHVSAPHFRDMRLDIRGCDSSRNNPSIPKHDEPNAPSPPKGPRSSDTVYRYWHTDVDDRTRNGSVTFRVDAADPNGSYTVALDARSRAYNPGSHPMNPDWDDDAISRDVHRRQGIAIVRK
jgi:hypothetical protein